MRFKGIEIRPPKKDDSVKAHRDHISELIKEGTFILIDKIPTMKEEEKWVKERLDNVKYGREIFLTAWDGKKHVGSCHATKDRWKDKGNVAVGISVRAGYRGMGLGEKLLRETIKLAKKKFKPKNIYLRVFADNRVAKSLYRKVGFRTIAHFPSWTLHKGKYVGHDYMLLKS